MGAILFVLGIGVFLVASATTLNASAATPFGYAVVGYPLLGVGSIFLLIGLFASRPASR